METQDFVAIDFETMTPELTSACAIGLVRVHSGVISQKFYSLIKPILTPELNATPMYMD